MIDSSRATRFICIMLKKRKYFVWKRSFAKSLFLNTSCKYQMNNKVLRLKFYHLLNIIFNEIMGFRLRCGIALANGIHLFIYRKSDLILVLFIINIKESIFIFYFFIKLPLIWSIIYHTLSMKNSTSQFSVRTFIY